MARVPVRPRSQVRTPTGAILTAEYDPFRDRWRITPGGYESRSLSRALAQASGAPPEAAWIQAAEVALGGEHWQCERR